MSKQLAPEPTVRLWDGTKQDYAQVPISQAATALKDPSKGQGFKPGDSYYFQYPDGELGRASNVNELYAALNAGGKEINKRTALLRDEAKGALGTALSFGSGAASSATFGLSDVAARGIDELTGKKFSLTDRILAAQEASPLANTLGQVGGAIGSAVLLPGGGLVGQAGKLATGAVQKAAGGALSTLAAKGTLGAIASSGAKLAATGALEGAAQGVGQTISQQALQSNPQGVVESLVANVGTGVIFGGAVGGALGAGGKALAPVIGTAGKAFTQVTGKLKGFSGEELAAQRGVFEPGSEALKVLRSPQKFEEQVADSTAKLMNDIEQSGISASTKMDDLIKATGSDPIKGMQAKSVISDYISAITKDPDMAPSIRTEFAKIQNKLTPLDPIKTQAIQDELNGLTQKLATPVTAAQKVSIESQIKSLQNQLTRDAPENALASIRQAKRELFDVKQGWATDKRMTGSLEAASGLEQVEGLEKVLKATVWDEATFGLQAGLLADLDEAIASRYSAFNALKDSGAIKKEGAGFVLKRNGVKALLRDEKNASLVEDLLAAEHKVQSVGSKLTGEAMEQTASDLPKMIQARQTVRSLFDNELMTGRSLGAGMAGYAIGGAPGALLAHALENPGQITKFLANRYSDSLKIGKLVDKDASWGVLQGVASSLNDRARADAYSRDLEAQSQQSTLDTSKALNRATSGLLNRERIPSISPSSVYTPQDLKKTKEMLASPASFDDVADPVLKASLMTQRQLVESYLTSKMPPPLRDSIGLEKPPTKQQLVSYGRTVEAATNPLKVIEGIGNGHLSREGLETLQAVYPALYESLKQEIKGTIVKEPSLKNKAIIAQIIGSESIGVRAKQSMNLWAIAFSEEQKDMATGGLHQGLLTPEQSMGMGMAGTGPKLKGIGSMGAGQSPRRGALA